LRVLVTGASGLVGGAIASFLQGQGWDVVGLSRTSSQKKCPSKYILADIGKMSLAKKISDNLPPCDTIIHAAASMDVGLYTTSISLTNCLGTQQILELANIWHSTNLIYISSVPVIGTPKQLPITEDHPTNPPTAYHASKLFGENLIQIAARNGLAGTILRITSPVGTKMPENRILPVFVKRALADEPLHIAGNGTRRQNYVDVRDISEIVENCLRQHVFGLFNIAGEHSISNKELAEICVQTLGSASKINFTGQPDPEESIAWDVSIAKAKKCLGYDPHYSIEDSISSIGEEYAARYH
jgi:UDP-glucose 4-epimerase